MHPDHDAYHRFTGRARLDKAVNSLLGLLDGVSIDSILVESERAVLEAWIKEYDDLRDRHPYNELLPVVERALADGVLLDEERADISWLCQRLRSTDYYDATTADIQKLHGILGGIAADGSVSQEELDHLSAWVREHEDLRTCWPYDEVEALITSILADGRIDPAEQGALHTFFSEFVTLGDERTITQPMIARDGVLQGICAACPRIDFSGKLFCFTGSFRKHTRQQLVDMVHSCGSEVASSVTQDLNYLVIGAAGNPCWAYACYGRKVEAAVRLRKQGQPLILVHEHDFLDALIDWRGV